LIRVPSSDGVSVAVHELGAVSDDPTLLISHATGFHAHCYAPIASELAGRFRCIGFDHRGHGDTDIDPAWETDWRRFGDDALAVACEVAPRGGLTGFGHSMGASSLLMAAHRAPELFDRLVLFEPISHEGSQPTITEDELRSLPIVVGALRRRREFPSFDAAYDNFRHKPPMSQMTPAVLRNYVDHGFREVIDADGDPIVELRCDPKLEASIFVTGRDNGVWSLLRDIRTPCLVIGGHVEDRQPSAQSEAIADELPNGEYLLLDHHAHFGPFSHPAEIADLIRRS
jgi:pimeloyl-ACP methyl ester carboxylesterase